MRRFVALAMLLFVGDASARPPFSFGKSTDGRYVTNNGYPFRFATRAAWLASANAVSSDIPTFLSDTSAQGFNSIILMLTVHAGAYAQAATAPANKNGDLPWTTSATSGAPTNPTFYDTANSAYYNFTDSIINQAWDSSIAVFLAFNYLSQYGQGWDLVNAEAHNVATTYAACYSYGQFLGARYTQPNIIWYYIGDNGGLGITTAAAACHHRIMEGIVNQLPGALFTAEGAYPAGLTSDETTLNSLTPVIPFWINTFYGSCGTTAGARTYMGAQTAWAYSPTTPVFTGEPCYAGVDGDQNTTRRSAWWSVLAGSIAGHNFGQSAVWDWTASWAANLTNAATNYSVYENRFFAGVPFHRLYPILNGGAQLLTSNTGAWNTDNYTGCALTAAADFAVCYIPYTAAAATTTQSVIVDMTKLGGTVAASWYDPTAGTYTSIGSFSNSGTHTFTTNIGTGSGGGNANGSNDWVLVLDARQAVVQPTASPSLPLYRPLH